MPLIYFLIRISPIFFNVILIIGTVIFNKILDGKCGNWDYIAKAVFLIVVILHIGLLMIENRKVSFLIYGLLNGLLSLIICILSILVVCWRASF